LVDPIFGPILLLIVLFSLDTCGLISSHLIRPVPAPRSVLEARAGHQGAPAAAAAAHQGRRRLLHIQQCARDSAPPCFFLRRRRAGPLAAAHYCIRQAGASTPHPLPAGFRVVLAGGRAAPPRPPPTPYPALGQLAPAAHPHTPVKSNSPPRGLRFESGPNL
jgi:hypothetical protein